MSESGIHNTIANAVEWAVPTANPGSSIQGNYDPREGVDVDRDDSAH